MEQRLDLYRIRQAYLNTFTSDAGEIVLTDMRASYNDRESFTPNDPHSTAYYEGQRSVFLAILRLMADAIEDRKQQEGGNEQ